MYVKKSISLLLSGALFASLCTGCSQTTMEHHFFTDTVTETEINTEVVENAITPKIEELQEILGDIKLEVKLRSDGIEGTGVPTGLPEIINNELIDESLKTIMSSDELSNGIKKYIESPSSTLTIVCFNCGNTEGYEEAIGLNDFISGTKFAVEQLCNTFEEVDDKDFLKSFKLALDENEDNPYLLLTVEGLYHTEKDKYYMIAILNSAEKGTLVLK